MSYSIHLQNVLTNCRTSGSKYFAVDTFLHTPRPFYLKDESVFGL